MKTTLERPDELARRVEMHAVQQDQKLKDAIAELLEIGLAHAPRAKSSNRPPTPAPLKHRGPLPLQDTEAAIAAPVLTQSLADAVSHH